MIFGGAVASAKAGMAVQLYAVRKSPGLVFLAAAVLLLYGYGLDHTPPHLHHDEVVISLQAHSIATTARDFEGRLLPLYFHMPQVEERAWYQPAIVYFTALFLKVLPTTEASFRFPTAVIATVDVLLMFLTARRLFGAKRWGWVAAVLLAATPTHYILGRVAFDFIHPLPFVLGWLLAMLIYLERRDTWRLHPNAHSPRVGGPGPGSQRRPNQRRRRNRTEGSPGNHAVALDLPPGPGV